MGKLFPPWGHQALSRTNQRFEGFIVLPTQLSPFEKMSSIESCLNDEVINKIFYFLKVVLLESLSVGTTWISWRSRKLSGQTGSLPHFHLCLCIPDCPHSCFSNLPWLGSTTWVVAAVKLFPPTNFTKSKDALLALSISVDNRSVTTSFKFQDFSRSNGAN